MFCLVSFEAQAQWRQDIADSEWRFEGSKISCELTHPIEGVGFAKMRWLSGEQQQFSFTWLFQRPEVGRLYAYAISPVWAQQAEARFLGDVAVGSASTMIRMGHGSTKRVLDALQSGNMVRFAAAGRDGRASGISVDLMPIGLGEVFQQYQQCVAQLIPMSYRKLRRVSLDIKGDPQLNDPQFTDEHLSKLAQVATYMLLDKEVRKLFVDAYHDGMSSEAADLDRSKNWGDMVVRRLTELGIEPERIIQRHHGRSYQQDDGGVHRRVTLRMERLPVEVAGSD